MDERTRRNLEDAGCPECLIAEFAEAHGDEQRVRQLRAYRRELLSGIHAEQCKLDCLDYLIYQLDNKDRRDEIPTDSKDER